MSLDVAPTHEERLAAIVSEDAVAFVAELHGRFGARRDELLAARRERAAALRAGGTLDFLPETRELRESDWRVAPPRADYEDRRREVLAEEMDHIHAEVGDEVWEKGRPEETRAVFERVALGEDFPEFLTLIAYDYLD